MAAPRIPLILGFAGPLPVAAILLSHWVKPPFYDLFLLDSAMVYGAVILSFIGGAHWGFAARAGDPKAAATQRLFARSVLPSLGGWVAVALGPTLAAPALSAQFLLVLLIDRWAVRSGFAPAWWMSLRLPLSLIMAGLYGAFALTFLL